MALRFPSLLFRSKQYTEHREEDLPDIDDEGVTGQQQLFVDPGFQLFVLEQTLVHLTSRPSYRVIMRIFTVHNTLTNKPVHSCMKYVPGT